MTFDVVILTTAGIKRFDKTLKLSGRVCWSTGSETSDKDCAELAPIVRATKAKADEKDRINRFSYRCNSHLNSN